MASVSSGAAQFWRGRRVWISGHTGFKGAWLWLWLRTLGANLSGYALAPPTTPSLWDLVSGGTAPQLDDVRDAGRVRDALARADPEVVFHLAAQALVKESYRDPLGTYATNVLGTAAVLDACRALDGLRCAIVVTSDKVYENNGIGRAFEEGDRLGGSDPYSSSKACAELVTESFRESFFRAGTPLATVRAGNVIGGGDWSADRLIPDCVRALAAGKPARLRYPDAVRPWQHVLEPLCGYLTLAEALAKAPESTPRAVNFGPDAASFCRVRDVVDAFSARFGGRPGWELDATAHAAESQALTLSSGLAQRALGWRPRLGIAEALAWTAEWYRAHAAKEDMVKFSEAQIGRYRVLSERP
jgi:CDP-glucose 4,6-dehydratase